MAEDTIRIGGRIKPSTKTRWENFLLTYHSTIRDSSGPELDKAMNFYMNNFLPDSENNSSVSAMTKTTLGELKCISDAFKILPTYPVTTPKIINSTIKNSIHSKTRRTFLRYRSLVIPHLITDTLDEFALKQNMQGFCEYVDKLTNEQLLNL
jgi:hypothetical protein